MIKKLQAANNFMQSKTMSRIDWVLAFSVLLYGFYLLYSEGPSTNAVITTIIGFIAIVLAKIKPAKIIKNKLDAMLLKKMKG